MFYPEVQVRKSRDICIKSLVHLQQSVSTSWMCRTIRLSAFLVSAKVACRFEERR